MAQRTTHEATLISAGSAGKVRTTHEAILISITSPIVGITYPLTAPAISGIGPKKFAMTEANVVGETESPFTFSQQEQQWLGQRFMLEVELPPLQMAEAEQWIAFLGSLYGKLGTFLMGDYLRPTPQGAMSGTPVVNGVNSSGANVLSVRTSTPSVTNWAVAGDYIQVTAGSGQPQRLFKVLQNANSGPSGLVALQIFPNIREALTDGTAIVTSNCAGTFRLMSNELPWKVDENKIYTITFKAKEAL